MVATFARNPAEIFLIFNEAVDHVFDEHNHRIQSWEQPLLSPLKLQQYADAIHQQGAPLLNCFGFVDGTQLSISRPSRNQRIVYNGHKRIHSLKLQSVALPNGIIGNLFGHVEGRRHDSSMLYVSGLLAELEKVAWVDE